MEIKVISTCKRDRNSTWANGATRKTTAGMKMVVEHINVGNGKKKSITRFVK